MVVDGGQPAVEGLQPHRTRVGRPRLQRRRHHERVRRAQCRLGANGRSANGEPPVDGDELHPEGVRHLLHDPLPAGAPRPDQDLGVGDGAHQQPAGALRRRPQALDRRGVVDVIAVEYADQDIGVEDGHRHSSRRASR
jgi:hypothetical protein